MLPFNKIYFDHLFIIFSLLCYNACAHTCIYLKRIISQLFVDDRQCFDPLAYSSSSSMIQQMNLGHHFDITLHKHVGCTCRFNTYVYIQSYVAFRL